MSSHPVSTRERLKARTVAAADRLAPERSQHGWVWDLLAHDRQASELILERHTRPFETFDLDAGGVAAVANFERFRNFEAREALHLRSGPMVIAPRSGWMVSRPLQLEGRGAAIRGWGQPGIRRYLAQSLVARDPIRLEQALSLRMKSEANYWHALHDLLGGKLRLAEEGGVPADVPIVISASVARTAYFPEVRALPSLQGRTWIVQGPHQFVRTSRAYFAETPTRASRVSLDYVRQLLDLSASDPATNDRLFVTRTAPATRLLANQAEVEAVCRRFGFRTVDTAGRSLAEQIELFSNAAYVVGIHGAGLANIIFRKNAPLRLLELFDGAYLQHFGHLQPTYFLISRMYGFDYRAMIGHRVDDGGYNSRSFRVDVGELERHLRAMLA